MLSEGTEAETAAGRKVIRIMKRRRIMADRDITAWLVYGLILCVSVLIVSGMNGSALMFYAAGPLLAAMTAAGASCIPGAGFAERQTAYRLGRDRMPDALLFLKGGVIAELLISLVLAAVILLAGNRLAGFLFGCTYDSMILIVLLPGVVPALLSGPMKGFLDGCGLRQLTSLGLYPAGCVTAVLAVILARFGQTRGSMAAQLLLNDRYGALYAGAGLALAVSAGWLVYFCCLLVLVLRVRRRFLLQEGSFNNFREERLGGIVPYYLRNQLLPFAFCLLFTGSLLADYRIGLHLYGGSDRTGFGLHWWDGFAGIALPLLTGLTLLIGIFVSRMPLLCVHEWEKERYRRFRIRYSMMLRLSSYLSIAASAFVFGAAKPIVQLFRHGLNAQARESAILTLKLGSIGIFFFTTVLLMVILFWEAGFETLLVGTAGAAFVVQLLMALLFMHALTISVKALPLAMACFGLAFLVILMVLASGSLLRHTDTAWLTDLGLTLLSAAAAAIPVCILNDFMTDEIIPVGSTILLLLIFTVCYVLFSLLFGAVDLDNIDRLPGGRYVAALARALGHH